MNDPAGLLPNYLFCYVCGDQNPLGLNVRFRLEGKDVVTDFEATPFHAGYPGRVHGGVLAALLDETMGWAPCVAAGRFCLAVELQIRYLKPVEPGARVTVRGRSVCCEGRIWRAEGEITGAGGLVHARGAGRYWPLSEAETDEVARQLTVAGEPVPLGEAIERARASRWE